MNKSELEKNAKPVFDFNPKAEKLYATSDGNYFLEEAKHLAQDHANKIGCKLVEISRSTGAVLTVEGGDEPKPIEEMTVAELRDFADEFGIELNGKLKADILQEIKDWVEENSVEGEDEDAENSSGEAGSADGAGSEDDENGEDGSTDGDEPNAKENENAPAEEEE